MSIDLRRALTVFGFVFALCLAARAPAQSDKGGKGDAPAKPDAPVKADAKTAAEPSVTEHSVTIGGKVIRYRATAGLLPLLDDGKKAKANVFHVAYERLPDEKPTAEGTKDELSRAEKAKRPITFAFNGGPGSSSVWLHMGALGPRRVRFGDEGEMLAVPAELVDNDQSWLDFTDLVFIDPVSTGYSRPADGEDAKQFHGLEEDIRAVAEFIRLYLVRSERWESPKYLSGESYGTTRASGLAAELQGRMGIYLSGITLVSPVLNFQTLRFDAGNDLPYWLFLPTYAATAWHHKKLAPPLDADLEKTLAEVEQWSQTEYVVALAAGDRLTPQRRQAVAEQLSRYTGLSAAYWLRNDLRVPQPGFCKEILRDQQRTVGRFDSRYKGIDSRDVGERTDYDPSYAVIQGPFTAALNAYVRTELKFISDVPYEILTGRVQPWNYDTFTNRYVTVADSLRAGMTQNPNLRVLVMSGYYDLATPHFAIAHTIAHLDLDKSVRGNISQTFYKAGHMMYLRKDDLVKFRSDAAAWYAGGR